MKYYELMDKIYWHWRRDLRGDDGLKPMLDYRSALLAIMELHKPYAIDEYPDIQSYCTECDHLQSQVWPCHTIEAIKKELK